MHALPKSSEFLPDYVPCVRALRRATRDRYQAEMSPKWAVWGRQSRRMSPGSGQLGGARAAHRRRRAFPALSSLLKGIGGAQLADDLILRTARASRRHRGWP